jgi:hypothetical protein
MSCAPSSRGTSKLTDDKQRETNSPVPVDANNAQQANEKVSAALFNKMDLVRPGAPKRKVVLKKKAPPVDLNPSAAGEDEKKASIRKLLNDITGNALTR